MIRRALGVLVTLAAATVARADSPPPTYAAVFDALAARIERDHVFPAAYARAVGHLWKDDRAGLRAELAGARDRKQALVALRHLQNSLRDSHCWIDAPPDLEQRTLWLGLRLWTGGTAAAPDVRIDQVLDPAVAGGVMPGDVVLAVDGTPIAGWIAARRFETAALAPAAALAQTADQIVRADLPWTLLREGDARVLRLSRDGKTREVTLHFAPAHPPAGGPAFGEVSLARIDCDANAPVDYGDVALAAVGANLCVYTSTSAGHPRVAVVRYLSFQYDNGDDAQALRTLKADHDVLARALSGAEAVVLDLHENHGGNASFRFLGWFTGGAWDHPVVRTRVIADLDEPAVSRLLWGRAPAIRAYRAAQQAHQDMVETRFACHSERCDHVSGEPADRVTLAPVAVLVGPDCVSSCDTFSLMWSAFRFGPLVGQQPAHAYTVYRLPVQVTGPGGENLGTIRLAVSQLEIRPHVSVEGEPLRLDWEAPRSFEKRTAWVRDAVAEARRLLLPR